MCINIEPIWLLWKPNTALAYARGVHSIADYIVVYDET